MCGRYVRYTPVLELITRFGAERLSPNLPESSYNIAPTHEIVIINSEGVKQIVPARWGLVPSWAKEPSIGNRMINARAETITKKPAFRHAFTKQRCLVPANGFYEWKTEGKRKIPMYFTVGSKEVFAFAGLYNVWTSPSGETLYTCTIITTEANEVVRPYHDRMPVILPRDKEGLWLDSSVADTETLLPLLRAYDADAMETWEVTPKLNRPEWDRAENIEPVS
jgi:putative SOS response-associated peptidase YedK